MGGMSRSNGDVDNVVEVAKDFAERFVGQASEDLQALKQVVQIGGSKLGDFLSDIQVEFFVWGWWCDLTLVNSRDTAKCPVLIEF